MVPRTSSRIKAEVKAKVKEEEAAAASNGAYVNGEVVWVKLKGFVAWPARVTEKINPSAQKATAKSRESASHTVLVTFFGKKQQHSYVNPMVITRWRQEGSHDANCTAGQKGREGAVFNAALKEAEGAAGFAVQPASGGKRKRSEALLKDDTPVKKEEDGGDEGKSEYERLRERNMARNAAILGKLDIQTIRVSPAAKAASAVVRGLGPNKRESEALPPRQRSLRIQGKDSEGQALPEGFREPLRFKPTISDKEDDWLVRRAGDLSLDDLVFLDRRAKGEEGAKEKAAGQIGSFMGRLGGLAHDGKAKGKKAAGTQAVEKEYQEMVERLAVSEGDVAKIVPERIFSIAVHPSTERLLVMAGDKYGKLGFFEPDLANEEECVTVLSVHSRPITSISIDPLQPQRLFTAAYDSVVRLLDVATRQSVAVWDADEDEHGAVTSGSFDHHRGQVWCGHETGMVSIIDAKARAVKPSHHALHSGKIRSVMVCPTDSNMVATASHDCTVRLWDVRKMPGKAGAKSGELMEWRHGKGVNFASWAPISGSHIVSTSTDDTLRVLSGFSDGGKKPEEKVIKHDNQTGRWLTPFRAVHDPKCDSAFMVGAMLQPRQIEVFSSASGNRIKKLTHDNFSTITSLNAAHPILNVIAGGNSSGKVFVWREPK